jgi:hypothetical protein
VRRREALMLLSALGAGCAQEPAVEWVCPMDPDIRRKAPGVCPRCKMKLTPGLPVHREYPLRVEIAPRNWRPGQKIVMRFEVLDPDTGKRVKDFVEMHEMLFHLFVVSGDLEFFMHEHPEPREDGTFVHETALPKAGFYRLLGDFYPAGGTPQMAVKTIFSAGPELRAFETPALEAETGVARGENLEARFWTVPETPLAGLPVQLHFEISPADGLEQYLAAWGHLLAASADLIDLIHTHPFIADGGPRMQFNAVFPRPGMHRLWPQFQRRGVVNTLRYTVEVKAL